MNLINSKTTLALAALFTLFVPASSALAARRTPAQGSLITAVEVYAETGYAAVALAEQTEVISGTKTECITTPGEDFSEYHRISIDLHTEGGRAALATATAAFLAGRKVYIESNDSCSAIGLFGWLYGGILTAK